MSHRFDIVVVGSGMAGASLAAAIGARAKVLLIEAEEAPGYHATGRSAAFWVESYGGPGVQPLTAAAGPALHALGVLHPRVGLTIGRAGQEAQVRAFAETFRAIDVAVDLLEREGIERCVPGLKPAWTCAASEPTTCDIDVARLHQHYLAQARQAGAQQWNRAALRGARRDGTGPDAGWRLELADGRVVTCAVLVNAAGAWADPVARMAGAGAIGIVPLRRSIAQLAMVHPVPDDLPLVLDIDGTFYFKPENGRLWLSPHDETPSAPCDAAPEEIDIALAIDRFQQVVDWPIERVEHRWAGLRSFAPDRLPVYGFDPQVAGFFWCAGQGGFGIQTAPAAADLAARLLLGDAPGAVDPQAYAPTRFAADA
ncbi:FAD-binding oxidoreductase [Novosphingobium sp. 1949]|uniref:FAD-binding oxidoreductase n=1 Tax=Novosphingobium organovorum TaxID=2930092 RepID=A0ABT0BBF8_9SPHN|nr:FAD-dependent oxidoreductase [Novosphingobium organovorum]MCJ2182333.1 FAD-binding oxidoreductase [Novosphingobium organovorum]